MLLVNPHSRRGAQLFSEFERELGRSCRLVSAHQTQSSEEMASLIRDGLEGGVRRFVVGGGDGTLSAAADVLAGTEGILGVLPLGTGNTFSAGLGLPSTTQRLVALLTEGPLARYDVGLAETEDGARTVFLNSLTMGFSQRLVELLSRETKDRLGHLAWIVEFRQALKNTPTLSVTLTWPEGRDVYETRQLVIVNGRTIAAGISATPASSGQDGLLEVFRLGGPSLLSVLRLGLKLLAGRLLTDHEAYYHMLPEVTVVASPRLPVTIDGEIWLPPPVTCRVLPGALWVITPSNEGQSPRRWPLVNRTLGSPRPLILRQKNYSAKRS